VPSLALLPVPDIGRFSVRSMNWLNDPISVANLSRQWGEYGICAA
jgi:hypothetical protein